MAEIIPTELIEHIFSYAVHVDTPTCLSICLTNKMGQKVATPALYRVIGTFARPDEGPLDVRFMEQRFKAFALTCRTLLENRRLAAHIKELRQYFDILEDSLIKHAPPPLDLRLARGLVDEELHFSPLARKQLDSLLENGYDVALPSEMLEEDLTKMERSRIACGFNHRVRQYLTFIMLACTNLQLLEIQGDMRAFSALTNFNLMRHHSRNRGGSSSSKDDTGFEPYVKRMDELIITNCEHMQRMLFYVRQYALMPGLRKLTVNRMTNGSTFNGPNDTLAALEQVQELTFNACIASPETLKEVVRLCPELKKLDIEAVAWSRYLDCSPLGESLLERTPLLEQLRIEWPPSPDRRERHHGIVQSLGSLRELEHLHTVSISSPVLFGWSEDGVEFVSLDDVLPHSVKHLEIIIDSDEFSPVDQDILTMSGAERLESLTILIRPRRSLYRRLQVTSNGKEKLLTPM